MNKQTHLLLIKDYLNIPKNEWGSYEYYEAFKIIDAFTLLDENSKFKYINYNKFKNKYEYKKENIVFDFIKISDLLNGLYKKELLSEQRYHKCHSMCIKLANYFENSNILTGYINILDSKIMHSILEFTMFDEVVVMDWTLNVIMNKEQYFKLTNFNVINIVSSSMIMEDNDLIYNCDITNKTYLLFRNELKQDLDKVKRQII